jgi:DNA mismatch repair protein MutS2
MTLSLSSDFHVMDERTFKTLELDSLVRLLARHVQSPLGRRRALALTPSTDLDLINLELDRATECVDYLTTGGVFGLGEIADTEVWVSTLRIADASLDPHQILAVEKLVSTGLSLRAQFADVEIKSRYPRLASIAGRMPDLRRMLGAVHGKILPNGEIDDSASPQLKRLRREINERRARVYRNLESLMRDRAPSVQEEIVTVRNGRFVIPVRTDARSQIPGVIHGLSGSGQTTFVEPLSVIDQNNELARLREQEEIEIAQILFSLTETLRACLHEIETVIDAISEIDFAQAKARLSIEFDCVRPQMNQGRGLMLVDARHPLLEHLLKQSGGKVVPISMELDEAHQTMVISGPNAGGKTVVVKTVGLLALMAQMGLPIPARQAALPVFHQALADIGDQQSIAANLSTFTAHMRNISEMAESVSPPALILLDEVGTGTDPDEGAALGLGIIDHFRRQGATLIATTHYNPIKVWASQTEGVLNASVEFDEQSLRPTYRLITGVAGASSGIEIARRMNLPAEIIDHASSLLDSAHHESSLYLKRLKSLVDEQESLRHALEEEREATAEKYARLDIEFAKREMDRRAQFESELARVISEFSAESERALQSVKDRVEAARLKRDAQSRASDLRRSAGVRLRKAIGDAPIAAEAEAAMPATGSLVEETVEMRERDRVVLKSLGKEGVIEAISGETYTVLIGSLRFRAKREELQLVKSAAAVSRRERELPRGVSASVTVDANFTSEINVIGASVDEATDRVDKFLDEAFMAGVDSLRIVHGHGKGALRRAVAELLSGHPHVESFRSAPANEGGQGATIVEMKK